MRLVLLVVLLAPAIAAADTAGDVTKAFTAFVEGVAAKQPVPSSLDTFVTPYHDDDPVPKDLAPVRALIGKAKVKVTKVVASKAGKSAWLVAEIPGKHEAMRASAFLVLAKDGWQVTATHWSIAVPNQVVEMCGAIMHSWTVKSGVPKDLDAPVRSVMAALSDGHKSFVKLLSDDKNALAIGSAADEVFTGGASIKSIFARWEIGAYALASDDELAARAGGDGELMWIVMAVGAPAQLCTTYRTMLVLQKEKAGWRIVHHHYSEEILP